MSTKEYPECIAENFLGNWATMFRLFRKPIIAAVNGFAVLASSKTHAFS